MKSISPIIDAHVHIFPPAMIARREELLAHDPWFGEAFGHPGARMRTGDDLLSSMENAGVDISIVVGWPWNDNDLCTEHNTYLAEMAQHYPDRIAWLGIVNPAAAGAKAEISRCIQAGAKGFGEINADGQGFRWSEPDGYLRALSLVTEAELPLMCHSSEPVGHLYPGKGAAFPQDLLIGIETLPRSRWVLAHWGGGLPFYELMPEVRLTCTNVAYDSAATSYLYDSTIFRRMIDLVGIEKVVFGSDWPVLAQGRLLSRIRALDLSEEQLEAVLGGNAARIYKLD